MIYKLCSRKRYQTLLTFFDTKNILPLSSINPIWEGFFVNGDMEYESICVYICPFNLNVVRKWGSSFDVTGDGWEEVCVVRCGKCHIHVVSNPLYQMITHQMSYNDQGRLVQKGTCSGNGIYDITRQRSAKTSGKVSNSRAYKINVSVVNQYNLLQKTDITCDIYQHFIFHNTNRQGKLNFSRLGF